MPLLRNVCLIFGVNLLLFAVYSEQAAKPAPRAAGRVQFNEVAAASGITFRHENGASAEKYMFETFVGEILDRVPGFGPARLERAKYFDREGQPDKAAEAARLALQSAGNDLNDERAAHGILARSYTALGDTGNASREQAWIEAHPNSETRVK
jgi:hypothetical protein